MRRVFWTKKQMEEVKALCDRYDVPAEVRKETERILDILDNVYGDLRDAQRDDGGFILFCTESLSQSDLDEILEEYKVRSDEAEYQDIVESQKGEAWEIRLYIITNDYGITMIFPQMETEA